MWKAFPDIALHLHPTFPVTSTKALRTTFIPSFTTFWARRQGVVCKRKVHRAKRHLKFYVQIYRSQWRVKTEGEESWKRLMMDSSELFTRKLRKHFESPPKREQIGPTLQQKGIFLHLWMIVLCFYGLRLLGKFKTISLKNSLGQALWLWSVNYFLMLIHSSDICPPFPHVHRSTDTDKYYTKANISQMNSQEQWHPEPTTKHQLHSVLFHSIPAVQDPLAHYNVLMEILESNFGAQQVLCPRSDLATTTLTQKNLNNFP